MNALDVIRWGDQFFRDSLTGIPLEDADTPGVCGVWSVRDVIAHISASERMLTDVLGTFNGIHDTPVFEEINAQGGPMGWNDWAVAQRSAMSVTELLAEYDQALARNIELGGRIVPATWREVGSLPWYGAEYDLEDYIVYAFYGHKREHGGEIRHFRSSLAGG